MKEGEGEGRSGGTGEEEEEDCPRGDSVKLAPPLLSPLHVGSFARPPAHAAAAAAAATDDCGKHANTSFPVSIHNSTRLSSAQPGRAGCQGRQAGRQGRQAGRREEITSTFTNWTPSGRGPHFVDSGSRGGLKKHNLGSLLFLRDPFLILDARQ